MFKQISIYLILLFSLVLFSCCANRSIPIEVSDKTEIETKIVERDTVFRIEADSSFYEALLECENGKVRIVTDTIYYSKTSQPTMQRVHPKINLEDNRLTMSCEAEAQELFATWKDSYQTKTETRTKYISVEKDTPWWQTTLMVIGVVFIILIIINFIKPFKI